jgi:modulator of FtsH protease
MAYEQNGLPTGFGAGGGVLGAAARNRVLRNTYALLALSMVPTVLGAWIGVSTGFSFFAGSPFIGLIVFLAVAFGFFFAIERFKNSAIGVGLLLAFTFFMGLMLSRLVGHVLGMSNGASLVMTAFGGTAGIFAVMATIANIWLQMPALTLTISALAVLIFSAFILFDLQRVINGGETNYVTATLSVYLSVYNVFSNLLAILGIVGGDRD